MLFYVFSGLHITPSSLCLRAYWVANGDFNYSVLRYQWSVSVANNQPGQGLLDILNEKVWFDVGVYNRAVFCSANDERLQQGFVYVFHVRAWIAFDKYEDYVSHGVMVDQTPPSLSMGKAIKEINLDWTKDIDYQTRTDELRISWDRVFSDTQAGLMHYTVSIGTTPGGVHECRKLRTKHLINNSNLRIYACNRSTCINYNI